MGVGTVRREALKLVWVMSAEPVTVPMLTTERVVPLAFLAVALLFALTLDLLELKVTSSSSADPLPEDTRPPWPGSDDGVNMAINLSHQNVTSICHIKLEDKYFIRFIRFIRLTGRTRTELLDRTYG